MNILIFTAGWLLLGFIGATIGTRIYVIDSNHKVTDDGRMLIFLTICGPTTIVSVLAFMVIDALTGIGIKSPVYFADKFVSLCKGHNCNLHDKVE